MGPRDSRGGLECLGRTRDVLWTSCIFDSGRLYSMLRIFHFNRRIQSLFDHSFLDSKLPLNVTYEFFEAFSIKIEKITQMLVIFTQFYPYFLLRNT